MDENLLRRKKLLPLVHAERLPQVYTLDFRRQGPRERSKTNVNERQQVEGEASIHKRKISQTKSTSSSLICEDEWDIGL